MHVSCALSGVAIEDRCVNWKQGVYKPCDINGGESKDNSSD